jgi:hypothetical protein
VAKRKEKKPEPLADWEVSLSNAEGVASGWHRIPASRWKRTDPGWYTFTDEQGTVAEFPPGVVLSVVRKEPPVLIHPPGDDDEGLRAARELGERLSARSAGHGPDILPVKPHGAKS